MAYHHGSLPHDLLSAAAAVVAESGPSGLNLRALARDLGVSHTAPRHHFGDKQGVITALAAQGYRLLAERLAANRHDFLEAGVAYVTFALEHPGHFAVMFRPELVDNTDPDLIEARSSARSALVAGATEHGRSSGRPHPPAEGEALPPYALLAWSAAHGIATLALSGALGAIGHGSTRDELTAIARASLQHLGPV